MKEAAIEAKKGGEKGLTPQSVRKATPVGFPGRVFCGGTAGTDGTLGRPREIQRLNITDSTTTTSRGENTGGSVDEEYPSAHREPIATWAVS